jgi:hypothetical protein
MKTSEIRIATDCWGRGHQSSSGNLVRRLIFVPKAVDPIPKCTKALADSLPQFWNLLPAKEEHGDSENDCEVRGSESIVNHDESAFDEARFNYW